MSVFEKCYGLGWEDGRRLAFHNSIYRVRIEQLGLMLVPNAKDRPILIQRTLYASRAVRVLVKEFIEHMAQYPLAEMFSRLAPFLPDIKASYLSPMALERLDRNRRRYRWLTPWPAPRTEEEADTVDAVKNFLQGLEKLVTKMASKRTGPGGAGSTPNQFRADDVWGNFYHLPEDLKREAAHMLLQLHLLHFFDWLADFLQQPNNLLEVRFVMSQYSSFGWHEEADLLDNLYASGRVDGGGGGGSYGGGYSADAIRRIYGMVAMTDAAGQWQHERRGRVRLARPQLVALFQHEGINRALAHVVAVLHQEMIRAAVVNGTPCEDRRPEDRDATPNIGSILQSLLWATRCPPTPWLSGERDPAVPSVNSDSDNDNDDDDGNDNDGNGRASDSMDGRPIIGEVADFGESIAIIEAVRRYIRVVRAAARASLNNYSDDNAALRAIGSLSWSDDRTAAAQAMLRHSLADWFGLEPLKSGARPASPVSDEDEGTNGNGNVAVMADVPGALGSSASSDSVGGADVMDLDLDDLPGSEVIEASTPPPGNVISGSGSGSGSGDTASSSSANQHAASSDSTAPSRSPSEDSEVSHGSSPDEEFAMMRPWERHRARLGLDPTFPNYVSAAAGGAAHDLYAVRHHTRDHFFHFIPGGDDLRTVGHVLLGQERDGTRTLLTLRYNENPDETDPESDAYNTVDMMDRDPRRRRRTRNGARSEDDSRSGSSSSSSSSNDSGEDDAGNGGSGAANEDQENVPPSLARARGPPPGDSTSRATGEAPVGDVPDPTLSSDEENNDPTTPVPLGLRGGGGALQRNRRVHRSLHRSGAAAANNHSHRGGTLSAARQRILARRERMRRRRWNREDAEAYEHGRGPFQFVRAWHEDEIMARRLGSLADSRTAPGRPDGVLPRLLKVYDAEEIYTWAPTTHGADLWADQVEPGARVCALLPEDRAPAHLLKAALRSSFQGVPPLRDHRPAHLAPLPLYAICKSIENQLPQIRSGGPPGVSMATIMGSLPVPTVQQLMANVTMTDIICNRERQRQQQQAPQWQAVNGRYRGSRHMRLSDGPTYEPGPSPASAPIAAPATGPYLTSADDINAAHISFDRLAAAVAHYGRQHGYDLRLGLLSDNREPQLGGGFGPFTGRTRFVWIYHDGQAHVERDGEVTMQRYAALKPMDSCVGNGRHSHYVLALHQGAFTEWYI